MVSHVTTKVSSNFPIDIPIKYNPNVKVITFAKLNGLMILGSVGLNILFLIFGIIIFMNVRITIGLDQIHRCHRINSNKYSKN